jgi:hypothetical protein
LGGDHCCRLFALQHDARFGTVSDVRMSLVLLASFGVVTATSAQEQERKLLDRLLRPDMTLANPAQKKQFVAGAGRVDRRASLRSFYPPGKSVMTPSRHPVIFATNDFTPRRTQPASTTRSFPNGPPRTEPNSRYVAAAANVAQAAPESDRPGVNGTAFSGSRPFLGRGKSQKELSAHDTPLTIDQVRDLLNKNK